MTLHTDSVDELIHPVVQLSDEGLSQNNGRDAGGGNVISKADINTDPSEDRCSSAAKPNSRTHQIDDGGENCASPPLTNDPSNPSTPSSASSPPLLRKFFKFSEQELKVLQETHGLFYFVLNTVKISKGSKSRKAKKDMAVLAVKLLN